MLPWHCILCLVRSWQWPCACTLYFHGSNCYVNTQQCYFVCTLPLLFKKLITGFVPSQQLPGFVAAFDMLPYLVVVSSYLLLFFKCCHISDVVLCGGWAQFKVETQGYPVKLLSLTVCGNQKLKLMSFCVCHCKQNMWWIDMPVTKQQVFGMWLTLCCWVDPWTLEHQDTLFVWNV